MYIFLQHQPYINTYLNDQGERKMKTKLEIEQYFVDIQGINEAKKVFKNLAKILHPDKSGTNEEFQILNSVYNHFLENELYFSNESKFDLEIEKIISQILHYDDLIIEVIGSWIWLSGETKSIKENLKSLGFKWASKKKLWYFGEMKGRNPHQSSMNDIKSKYGFQTVKTKSKKTLS